MQASGKSALQYLKLFFLASFEHGNLTEQTAKVSPMTRQNPYVNMSYEYALIPAGF